MQIPRSTRRLLSLLAIPTFLVPLAAGCSTDPNDGVAATTTAPSGASTSAPTTTADGESPATTTIAPVNPSAPYDIVGTALGAGSFTELAGLVVDAGLVDALRGGPFTVFAPTDAAFAKLPLDVLHSVQDDPKTLAAVLGHHVVAGAIGPEQLAAGTLTTIAGDTLTITKQGDTFLVDGKPIGAAVAASNGQIYVMSDVLVPG